MDLNKIVEECLTPISEDKPSGSDCKNLEIYTPFKTEIKKIINVSSEKVDWDKLLNSGISLISKRSKDIEIACYLTIALFKSFDYEGFLTGLTVFTGIIEKYPNSYFPFGKTEKKSAKLRRNVVNAFNDRSVQFIRSKSATSADAETIKSIWEQLQTLKALIENVSVPPPSISELFNVIGEAHQKYPVQNTIEQEKNDSIEEKTEDENTSAPKKNPEKQEKKTQSSKTSSTKSQISSTVNIKDIDNFHKILITLANGLRVKNSKNPVAYRMKRMAVWDSNDNLPELQANGNTKLAFNREMKLLQDAFLKGNAYNEAMIERLESNFDIMLWWMDLQRMIVQTMEQVSPEYKKAASAIRQEVKYLLKRFPDLPTLKFKGGESFANSETHIWLDELASDDGNSEFDFPSYLIDQNLKEDIKAAEKLADDDKVTQALSLIQDGIRNSVGMKDIFCRKMAAGRFCLNNQRIKESQILFEYLFQQGKNFNLAQWDPLLFLELCQNFDKAIKLNPNDISDERKNEIASETRN
ncbi:Type VI secretion system-associated, partial [Candidatus Magnetomorum sp. HK-1]